MASLTMCSRTTWFSRSSPAPAWPCIGISAAIGWADPGPDPDDRRLVDRRQRRQSFMSPQLLGVIGHQYGVGHLDPDDEDHTQERLHVDGCPGEVEGRKDADQAERHGEHDRQGYDVGLI